MTLQILPMGERAVLLTFTDSRHVLPLYESLQHQPLHHQVEAIPGAETVLICFDRPAATIAELTAHLKRRMAVRAGGGDDGGGDDEPHRPTPLAAASGSGASPHDVIVEAHYDGPDLADVADYLGVSPAAVIAAHTSQNWRAAFNGFSPGFGYLTSEESTLIVPRRDTPRPHVGAGSVGLAGAYSGVYPRESPGGWQLIAHTTSPLWDLDRDPPALIQPGGTVRFVAVREVMTIPTGHTESRPSRPASDSSLEVIRPGLQILIQDLGRAQYAHFGVSPAGAADRGALQHANQLVGNELTLPGLEILLGGSILEAHTSLIVAVTGAPVSVTIHRTDATAKSSAAEMGQALELEPGDRLQLGRATAGLRCYLAIRGGISVPAVLGSRSTDTLSGLGPAALQAGDQLSIGDIPLGTSHSTPPAVWQRNSAFYADTPIVLDMVPGPQQHWFASNTIDRMSEIAWIVSPASNRIGVRLLAEKLPLPAADGDAEATTNTIGVPALVVEPAVMERIITDELPTQGLVRGAIQVPPSGELVVLGPDCPVTGGYPVIGVLTEASADRIAQARPGARVRLRPVP